MGVSAPGPEGFVPGGEYRGFLRRTRRGAKLLLAILRQRPEPRQRVAEKQNPEIPVGRTCGSQGRGRERQRRERSRDEIPLVEYHVVLPPPNRPAV